MKNIVLYFLVLGFCCSIAQNVGIGTATPDASAKLDITDTQRGILIPRVALSATNVAAPVTSPATSLLVYNTATAGTAPNNVTPGYYYWGGTQWIRLLNGGTPGDAWHTLGNTGTIDGTHFLGTTDNVPLNFRVNNEKAGRIASNGPTFLGYQAGNSNTDLTSTGIGFQALYSNTTGSSNTATGYAALSANTTGTGNTATGHGALNSNTTGYTNTATGYGALLFNTTGYRNTAIGFHALVQNTIGFHNTGCGVGALRENTTGSNNTSIGENSLYYNSTGSENVAVGRNSGVSITGVNFNQCTFIGALSFPTVNRTNVTMLGYGITNAECTGNNQVLLGNTAITQIRAQVTGITAYSDKRFKTNIQDDVKGLDFITKLKPVTYNENPEILHQIWATPDSLLKNINHSEIKQKRFIGLLAQDVEQAAKESGFSFPGIDIPKNEKEVYSLRYVDFIMPIIKAIQEQQQIIEKQQQIIEKMQQQNEYFQTELNKLKRERLMESSIK